MPFDLAFQPIVVAGRVIFGSSADDKVYALDLESGGVSWTFFTEGPIRFAPAGWRDRVFVASDDGTLYALSASDGRLLWRHRAALLGFSVPPGGFVPVSAALRSC
jgi:outer membrane protein assembly factor BamB